MQSDIQVVQPIQLHHLDTLHRKPKYDQKSALWVRGVHYVIQIFSAIRLPLPEMDICHLKWNGRIVTRAPWTVFRRAKTVMTLQPLQPIPVTTRIDFPQMSMIHQATIYSCWPGSRCSLFKLLSHIFLIRTAHNPRRLTHRMKCYSSYFQGF